MVLKHFEKLGDAARRALFNLALALIAVSVVFNFFAWQRIISLTNQNASNVRIIKAVTGCDEHDSIASCKQRTADQQAKSFVQFQVDMDCRVRRAIAHVEAPVPGTPCALP